MRRHKREKDQRSVANCLLLSRGYFLCSSAVSWEPPIPLHKGHAHEAKPGKLVRTRGPERERERGVCLCERLQWLYKRKYLFRGMGVGRAGFTLTLFSMGSGQYENQ